jgi:class II lanthipeptide synthase
MTASVDFNDEFDLSNRTAIQWKFATRELKNLVADASTLEERLSGQYVPKTSCKSAHLAKARFKSWAKSLSNGNPYHLSDIFSYYKIDPVVAEPLFGEVELCSDHKIPDWTGLFNYLVNDGKLNKKNSHSFQQPENLCASERCFYSLIVNARYLRDFQADPIWLENLSDKALDDLDLALLEPLVDHCLRALDDAPLPTGQDSRQDDIRERAIVQELQTYGIRSFFLKRPVLARMISTMVDQWRRSTLEFLERLHRDLNTKISTLMNGCTSGSVISIGYGLSELNNEGRSIYRLTFENNQSVGYKPKDLRIDQAWNNLINWLNRKGAPRSADVPNVQVCDGYGWVEWITPKPCTTQSEAEAFYYRSGATLCLIRILQGNDFHYGNVIAHGPAPVPLDLETVLQAYPKQTTRFKGAEKAFKKATKIIDESVLSTGYLPGWYNISNGKAARLGGLDIAGISETPLEGFSTQAALSSIKNRLFHNVPHLNDRLLKVKDYEENLIAGYETMFQFLAKAGKKISGKKGPLKQFEDVTFRSIFRPTHFYSMLMTQALKSSNVKYGVDWCSHLDTKLRSVFTQEDFGASEEIRMYERACLSTFNIPFYSGSPNSTTLTCGDNRTIPGFFQSPCLTQVKRRLRNLKPDLLKRDLLMIRQCISVTDITESVKTLPIARKMKDTFFSNEDLLKVAMKLEKDVNNSVIRAGGGATWLGLSPVTADERKLQLGMILPSFLCGTLGIGIFQASLYRLTGQEKYRVRARQSAAIALQRSKDINKMFHSNQQPSLGLGFGIGGIVYGLVTLAKLLKDCDYLTCAQIYAEAITPLRIRTCADFGLMSGVAGAITGLHAFYRQFPSPEIASKILACSKHLMEYSSTTGVGGKAWTSQSWSIPQIGMMHGASGISLALARVAQTFNLPQFNKLALEGLEYETSIRQKYGHWPDLRDLKSLDDIDQTSELSGYANGVAGIGLTRLYLEKMIGSHASVKTDLDYAINKLSEKTVLPLDDLFTGNL